MKTISKIILSIVLGICLICIGLSMGGANHLDAFSFMENFDLRLRAHQISNIEESLNRVNHLTIDVTQADVVIHEETNRKDIQINCRNIYEGFKITHDNDYLKIKQPHYWFRKYDYPQAQIDIYVPTGYTFDTIKIQAGIGKSSVSNLNAQEVNIDAGMGDMYFQDIQCDDFDLDTGMGKTVVYNLLCQDETKVDVGMGSVMMSVKGKESDFDYKIDVGMGSVKIGHQEFSGITEHRSYQKGNSLIDVTCGMGSVELNMEE